MANYILESSSLRCEFDRSTGALVRLTAPETGWAILDRTNLGLSFRLMVPLGEELRNNNVFGEKQKLASAEAGENSLTFRWNGVESERGGFLPVNITMRVAVEGRQIVWYVSVDNRSDYTVEAVYAPYLGDVRPPKDAAWLKTFCAGYASANESNLWPEFDNLHGYFGVDYPTQLSARTPAQPFYLIRSENEGLYAGVKARSWEPVAWGIELRPGWDSSIDRRKPAADEIAGKPVHTPFAAVHTPYILPGESRALTPVALEAFRGGWQNGADIYKNWRETVMTPAVPPEWAKNPHSWQQLHINSPEDELRMRFTELPKVAAECKKRGVAAIQLVGWNDGGQDQGNPSHDPDPRLGTFEELRDAIAQCHAMGVKIILFSKFTWADKATDRFRKELINDAATDPYGDYYHYGGYQYFTPAQLLDINTKRLIPMCFHSERYMRVCDHEFQKIVDLGAAGTLYDECQHHTPSWLCFSEAHGHRYGAPVYAKDVDFIKRLRKAPRMPSDFLMSGEACYDWEMEAYQLAYFRTESKTHIPLYRYIQPRSLYMTAATGFNDRNMINQCLMYRYIVSYEPYNFKGRLEDFPDTITYGEKMDALRTEYRKWFWDGEFRDTIGADCIDEKGEKHPTYSVFKADDGSLGAVIANYEDYGVKVRLTKENGQKFTQRRAIDDPELKSAAGWIEIPARSAVAAI